MKIFIFDLDDTLTNNCFDTEFSQTLIIMALRKIRAKNWKIYVVTARPSNSMVKKFYKRILLENERERIIKMNMDPRVVHLLKPENPREDWLYYLDDNFYNFASILQNEHAFLRKCNITSIVKFLQIEDIKLKNPTVKWNDIYFFDDAKYHKDGMKIWKQINPQMVNNMNFIGGDGECVFLKNKKILFDIINNF